MVNDEVSFRTKETATQEVEGVYLPKIVTHYESLGNYKDTLKSYFEESVDQYRGDYSKISQKHSFYLNSSDSLETLVVENFENKRVMTVSGSGEFSHAFIMGGAKEIVSFDLSPAAAFYSELRHVALCALGMEDYKKLFNEWHDATYEDSFPILNQEIFTKVDKYLSEEARYYFLELFKIPEIFNHGGKRGDRRAGFSRMRRNKKYGDNSFVGDIVKNDSDYEKLQKKAQKIKFTQVICDVSNIDEVISEHQPDLVYISNIDYYSEKTIKIAKHLIDIGIPEVLLTANADEEKFKYEPRDDDYFSSWGSRKNDGGVYYENRKLEPGKTFRFSEYDEELNLSHIPVEVVGIDDNSNYGLTFRVSKKS